MYLHLGQDTVVPMNSIVGVFDMENSTVSKHTKEFLARAQREHRVINVSMELPKSFIVCQQDDMEMIYISQISPATLLRRAKGRALEAV